VPLCFEKSMWTVVAMLAVLKAGGAFVPLDPDHPASRHEDIFKQTGAQFVLASVQFSTLWVSSGRHVVTVSEASTSQLPTVVEAANLSVEPGNAAYIIFTSGSTGIPKGVVLEHSGCDELFKPRASIWDDKVHARPPICIVHFRCLHCRNYHHTCVRWVHLCAIGKRPA